MTYDFSEEAEMTNKRFCKFMDGWAGQCTRVASHGGYCVEHEGLECVSCGNQATHSCPETLQLVCGAPLCDDCIHTLNAEQYHTHTKRRQCNVTPPNTTQVPSES